MNIGDFYEPFYPFLPISAPHGRKFGPKNIIFGSFLGGDFVPPCVTVGYTGYACGYGYCAYHRATSHDKKPSSTFWGHFTLYGHFSPNIPISLLFIPPNTVIFNPICHVFNQNMTILTPNITKFAPLWTFSPKTWRYFPFIPNFCPKIWTFLCRCDSNMRAFNLLGPFLPQILPFLNIL